MRVLRARWEHRQRLADLAADLVAGLVHVRRNYTDNREKVPKGKRVRSVPMTTLVGGHPGQVEGPG